MKPYPRLDEILASKEALQESMDARRRLAALYREDSAVRTFLEMSDTLTGRDLQQDDATIRSALGSQDWVESLVYKVLDFSSNNHLFGTSFGTANAKLDASGCLQGVVLIDHPNTLLTLMSSIGDAASSSAAVQSSTLVRFCGQRIYTKFCGRSLGTYTKWECEPLNDTFDASAANVCTRRGVSEFRAGDVLQIDGQHEAITFEGIEEPLSLIQVQCKSSCGPIVADFDRESQMLKKTLPVSKRSARAQLLIPALRAMRHPRREEILRYLTKDNAFFVRWQAMRNLIALLGINALEDLEEFLIQEKNPAVLRAAHRSRTLLAEMKYLRSSS